MLLLAGWFRDKHGY